MGVRLRQICLVGADIDYSVQVLTAMFDTHVAFRDPAILRINLFNALLGFGDCFLEIVSPTDAGYEKNSTSVKLLRKCGGDCGYMAILQVDDVGRTSKRLHALGRLASPAQGGLLVQGGPGAGMGKEKGFRYKIGDPLPKKPGTSAFVNIQWHPKDFGTLMEIEEQWPPGRGAEGGWLPAGNRWQHTYKTRTSSVCQEFAGVDIAVAEPAAMARKYSDGLECPVVGDGTVVQLDGSVLRFVPVGADGREGVVCIDVYAAPGKPKAFTECSACGVRWRLVDRPGAPPTAPLYETLRAAKL